MDDEIKNRFEKLETRFDTFEKHIDTRFDAINERFNDFMKLLIQIQSDLRQFYFKLGEHEARLDNLEGK